MEQGSPEWFEARLGNATGSRISDLMAKTKSGYSASRANYIAQCVVERLTGEREETYQSAAMSWGIETEPYAREAYEIVTGNLVSDASYVPHPTIVHSGASPDGLINDDGVLEIKCPNTATHIKTLLAPKVPRNYALQVQWEMACTDRQWCDFVSYDPRMPDHLKYYCQRIQRNDELIEEIGIEVVLFLEEVDKTVKELKEYKA